MFSRRIFVTGSAAAIGLGGLAINRRVFAADGPLRGFEIVRTAAEWREMLSPEQFAVLREEATERPYTSALLEEHRAGSFHCAGCDNPLYASATKYDSRTGWPSFWEELPGAVGTREDRTLWMIRTEVHCARCGGHLGHVFEDGPEPTGLRHCINGLALTFRPAESA